MAGIAAMRADKERFIPAEGFNLVGVDDFEEPGEQRYLIGAFSTREDAEAAQRLYAADNPSVRTYIYGPGDH